MLYANGQTISISNDVGSGSVTVTLTNAAGAGTAGGKFTFNVNAETAKTLYTNITAGTVDCLEISGAGSSGTELTIIGNLTGGGTAAKSAVIDSKTVAGATVVVTGNLSGGTSTNTYGYNQTGATGTVTITGNATASTTAAAFRVMGGSTGTINGDCIGSTAGEYSGCVAPGTGAITITGNIVNAARGAGAQGTIIWAPSSAQKYIKILGSGTAIYAGAGLGSDAGGTAVAAADTAAEISTGKYFIKKDDGVYTQGTKSAAAGGGAWGF